MRSAHTVAQVRAAEAAYARALPPGTLMQRAAAGLAVACARRLGSVYGSRVVLLVGGGDNGADALWAGARLAGRGAAVTAVLTAPPRPDALAALLAAGGRVADAVPAHGLVVDGLVGIGAKGPLREAAASLAASVEGRDVVAVDLPSGVDADTGAVEGAAVRAALTLTFGTYKPGLLVGTGRTFAGRVELVDIGLVDIGLGDIGLGDIGLGPALGPPAVEALELADVARLLPRADASADKYSRGVVGVAAGSQQYTGAAVLCVGAAVRAGAGMVRFAGAAHPAEQIRLHWPEAVVHEADGEAVVDAGRVQAWVLGPGLGTDSRAEATVAAVLAQDVPVLVDADALTVCARHPDWLRDRTAPTLLTPHDREIARFLPLSADRVGVARRLAQDLGVTVLLKGDATVVVHADGPARANPTGSPVLATAGTGDVLAGGCGALLAQGLSPRDAGSVGAFLHGRAGALAANGASTSAGALLACWPDAVREAARMVP